jgi:hypothetical protein
MTVDVEADRVQVRIKGVDVVVPLVRPDDHRQDGVLDEQERLVFLNEADWLGCSSWSAIDRLPVEMASKTYRLSMSITLKVRNPSR